MVSPDKKVFVNKNKTLKDSFKNAYEGIKYALIKERNMHIHMIFAIAVIILGAILQISYTEWLISLVLIAMVISLELINTAIEATVDLITTKEDPLAKVAKDAASGAVLIVAVISAVIGIIIFVPKFFCLVNL